MNSTTPFFPQIRHVLAPMGRRVSSAFSGLRHGSLDELYKQFESVLPESLFSKNSKGTNSRHRIYTQFRTFWAALWQTILPETSDRHVVRQLQAFFCLKDLGEISSSDSAYCQARGRLCDSRLQQALEHTAKTAQRKAPQSSSNLLQNRSIKVVDGTTVTLPDTPKNRNAFPKVNSPEGKQSCVFPMARVLVFFCLASGAILSAAHGNLRISELNLLSQLCSQLKANDIVLGDRGFGNFVVVNLLRGLGVDFLGRSIRGVDGRKRFKRLGHNDWLVRWRKSRTASSWLSAAQWAQLGSDCLVRMVRGEYRRKGFRLKKVTLVTTLLDAQKYPAEELLLAYGKRWRLEMCLDDLKTILGMEMLRWQSPAKVKKELWLHLIAHNLVRIVMAEAGNQHGISLERLSFKGTLDAMQEFGKAMSRARTKKKRRQLQARLLEVIADDEVPERPGRREPRAVKRLKRKYPRLIVPRRQFTDKPKRHTRRKNARNLRNSTKS